MTSGVNFRALFEYAPDNYLVLAPDPPRFTMVAANEARLQGTMTRRDEVIGRALFEVFPDNPRDPEATGVRNLRASLEEVLRTGKPHRMALQKYDIRTPAGEFEERYWEPLNSPVFDERGELINIIHRVEDVTEQVRSATRLRALEEEAVRLTREAAARAEEERARREIESILESITDAFFAVDREWRFTYVNREAERLLRRPREELLGRTLWEEFPDIAGTASDREYRRAMAEQVTVAFEQYYPPLKIWADARAYPSAGGLSIFFRDVTARRRAEEALRESEGRYRLLADMIPQHIWTTDASGYHKYFSRRWYEFSGATLEQTQGEGWLGWIHPEDRERTIARWHESLRTGKPYSIEYRFRGADGEYCWFLGQAMPLRNEAGEIIEWFGTLTDISERKRLDAERDRLLAREEKARAAAEAAEGRARFLAEASGVLASSLAYEETLERVARLAVPAFADWCIVYRSEAGDGIRRLAVAARDPARESRLREVARRFPVTPENPVAAVVRNGESALFARVPESLLERIAPEEDHLRLLHEIGFRSLILVPLRVRGRTLGAIGFGRVEAGTRYGEADLRMAEELARRAAGAIDNARLFEEAEEARGEAERRAREEEALRKAAAAVGAAFTIDEMVDQIAQSALAATDADSALVERIDLERGELEVAAVAGNRTLPIEARMEYNGSLAEWVIERGEPEIIARLAERSQGISPLLLRACPDCAALTVPLLEDGAAIGALILLRDPERRSFRPDEADRARTFADLASLAFRKVHLLEETERRRDELVQVMESRARLVRGFSHDVKNPLGAADGYLQLMEEGIVGHLSEKQEESVARARRSIATALKLIEDLTELARAEAGKIEIERQPVDVRQVAWELGDEYRARAEAEGLTIDVEVPGELPLIETDAARVRQILSNLLSNATKYTSEGGITVRVALRDDGKAPRRGRWLAVDVADTGPGISPEQRGLVFQEFRRLDTAGETTGAGIGLAISHRLACALGGDITLESEVGKGSTFTLWLPLETVEGAVRGAGGSASR